MKTARRYAAPDLSPHAANDSPIASAVKAAFDVAGNANPHQAVYLDAIRNVRQFRWTDARMLTMVATREVGLCIESAQSVGLTIGKAS
jgi:hypothetical protein